MFDKPASNEGTSKSRGHSGMPDPLAHALIYPLGRAPGSASNCSVSLDARPGEAGQRARLLVIGWIRARLPAGSPGAYAPDELAQLSAQRTSSQPFVPYE